MNPLYLPERQHIRRKQAEWEEAVHQHRAHKRMASFRRRRWWFVYGPLMGFLGYLALWSFIALVFTAFFLGFHS